MLGSLAPAGRPYACACNPGGEERRRPRTLILRRTSRADLYDIVFSLYPPRRPGARPRAGRPLLLVIFISRPLYRLSF